MSTQTKLAGVLFILSNYFWNSAFAFNHHQSDNATAFLSTYIENKRSPGLQYMFLDSENIIFEFYGGFSDLEKKIPVTKNTTFNGYSITKTFTAAAIITLAQSKEIDLDAPISRYLTDFPYDKSPTIRQTLNHTAGFPNPNPITWVHLEKDHNKFDEQSFIQQVIHKNNNMDYEPGEKFSYSNIGYLLLGEVVRQVSGKSYIDFVTSEIISPLNLSNNKLISYSIDDPESHARGYIRRWNWLNLLLGWFIDRDKYLGPAKDGWVPFHLIMVNGSAYGGLVGNARGFAAYLQAILKARSPFNQEMLDIMWSIKNTTDGKPARTGLAWFHGMLEKQRFFAHSGGAGGYYCEIRVYPDLNRASVIMTNNTGISDQHLLDEIDHLFLENNLHSQ